MSVTRLAAEVRVESGSQWGEGHGSDQSESESKELSYLFQGAVWIDT
jgi:hypothetical protein